MLSQPLTKLLEIVQAACGVAYAPTHSRRMAKAEADNIKVLERAKVEARVESAAAMTTLDPAVLAMMPGVPEDVLDRARARLAHQELTRQHNIDNVVAEAMVALPDSADPRPVDPSFITRFFSIAAEVGDEEMQKLWGKVLAGETSTPGRFSVRSLDVLRNLTQTEAEVFRRACSLVFGANEAILTIPAQRPSGPFYVEDDGALGSCGLSFADRTILVDAGLIHPKKLLAKTDLAKSPTVWRNNGRDVEFKLTEGSEIHSSIRSGFDFLSFTVAGNQLGTLVENNFQPGYLKLLAKRFAAYGITVAVKNV